MGTVALTKTRAEASPTLIPAREREAQQRLDLPVLVPGAEVVQADRGALAYDFAQVSVFPERPRPTVESCPWRATPGLCPFGGACHACPTHVQRKLAIGEAGDGYEREADRVAAQVMRMPASPATTSPASAAGLGLAEVPPIVHEVLRTPGQPLDAQTRDFFEPRFGHDFSKVRVHTGAAAAESARAVNALAYTVGREVVFGEGRYAPAGGAGRKLLGHELAHVAQQSDGDSRGRPERGPDTGVHERGADRAAALIPRVGTAPTIRRARRMALQRRVEMRDVGRGERSGFARRLELVDRLSAMSHGLTFSLAGTDLTCQVRAGGTLSDFDRQMMEFIRGRTVIPMRLTDRQGWALVPGSSRYSGVEADVWPSGYVDIDDLLASTDLGLQLTLVHLLRERAATRNYVRRIGSPSLDYSQPGPRAEFRRVHSAGIGAEVQLLQDLFSDPTIRLLSATGSGASFRIYRNDRRDQIHLRMRPGRGAQRGVEAVSVEVRTRDGTTLTPDDYRALLERERIGDFPVPSQPPRELPA